MTKHLLAGAAAVVLMSGVAFGETNPPVPPPVDASRSTTCRLFAR
jgi:hypothetical protein